LTASLFDPQPKSNPRYLYARDKELGDLVNHVKNLNWVILLGPRRVGKTSLARCAATRLGVRTTVVDARIDNDLARGLVNDLAGSRTVNIQGGATIPHVPIAISASYTETFFTQTLDQLLSKVKRLLVIVDEAQWLKNPRGGARLMAHVFDYHYERVTFVVTGSAVGVMKTITEPGAKSPLYGRAMTTMEATRWRDPSTSLGFIKEGCRQNKVPLGGDEMARAVETLDGIPGWLTLFGYNYVQTRNANRAMERTRNEAVKIVKEELESTSKLALGWQRQLKILRAVSDKGMRFSEIATELNLQPKTLSRNLDMLERLQYIETDREKNYVIVDPIVREVVKASPT
jgi:AAA+ ATPase superfamily predicted ATPase